MLSVQFKGKVWLYQGPTAWHFVSLPKRVSADLKKNFGSLHRGWGSLRVTAKVGKTLWKTSIFSDSKRAAYILPIKAEVRAKEAVKAGKSHIFSVSIEV